MPKRKGKRIKRQDDVQQSDDQLRKCTVPVIIKEQPKRAPEHTGQKDEHTRILGK